MMHAKPPPAPTMTVDERALRRRGRLPADLRSEARHVADVNALLDEMPPPPAPSVRGVHHEAANGWLLAAVLVAFLLLAVLP